MKRNSDKYKYFGSDKGETYKTIICNNADMGVGWRTKTA